MQALQPIIVPLFLIFVGSILTFMDSWYWFTKSSRVKLAEQLAEARVKEADRLAVANEKLLSRLTELEKQFGAQLPKGASVAVDNWAREFVARQGLENLPKVAKMHFRNAFRAQGLVEPPKKTWRRSRSGRG